jgi:hypothetical protein
LKHLVAVGIPRVLLACIVGSTIWSLPAVAWNATGHKATAEIAYGLMLPEQQENVARILRAHPRFADDFETHMPAGVAAASEAEQASWIFGQASIWPDFLRGLDEDDRALYNRSSWHYINVPIYLEEKDEAALKGQLEHNMSMQFSPPLRQNLNVVQALRGNLLVWNDSNSTHAEKAVALCWILHLVGDLHQPLHSVALFSRAYYPEGDRGGNSIRVSWDPEPINLHSAWDRMPDRFEDLQPGDLTRDLLRSDVALASSIDFWLKRHHQLATVFVYTKEVKEQLLAGLTENEFPEVELSEFYISNGVLLAKEQVILAGHRIAGLLE